MQLSRVFVSVSWITVSAVLIGLPASDGGDTRKSTETSISTALATYRPGDQGQENRYCGYLLFNVKPPKRLNITVGGILYPPEFQSLYNRFKNGSVILVDQPDQKVCKIVICGAGGSYNDYGDCYDFWKTTSPVDDRPYSSSFEMSSARCGCGTGITTCGFEKCDTKVIEEYPELLCAVLYEEYNCQECYFKGIPLMHEDAYDTQNSNEVLSVYVRPGCNLRRTMGPPLNYPGVPKYEYAINSSRGIQDLTFSRVADVYKCECHRILASISTTSTTKATTQITPKLVTTKLTSMNRYTETPENSTEVTQEPIKSDGTSEGLADYIIGAGVFVGLSVCVICIVFGVMYSRRKARKRSSESIPMSLLGVKSYIKEFIEGAVVRNDKPVGQEITNDEKPEYPLPNKAYCTALALPYDSKYEINRNHINFSTEDAAAKIGYGAFGLVYKGTLLTFDDKRFREIAIKTLAGVSDISGKEFLKSLLNEIKVLSYIGYHENIVYFIGACTVNLKKGEVFLIMDYCTNGSLLKYVQNIPVKLKKIQPKPHMPNDCKAPRLGIAGYLVDDGTQDDIFIEELSQEFHNLMIQWSMQIAGGMEFLSSRNVLHIDLAARNVLLTEDLTAKISDFGLSRKLYTEADYKKNQQDVLIPIPWMALETVTERRSDKRYSKKSDVWAYGVTIWEAFTRGKDPYEGMGYQEIFCMLNQGERLSQPQFAPADVYNKMLDCWAQDPEKRPNFADLKDFFQRILKNYEREIKCD